MSSEPDYPRWVCHDCGVRYGKLGRQAGVATYHPDTCDVCGQHASCTVPRDFGHLRDGWKQHAQPCDAQGRGD